MDSPAGSERSEGVIGPAVTAVPAQLIELTIAGGMSATRSGRRRPSSRQTL